MRDNNNQKNILQKETINQVVTYTYKHDRYDHIILINILYMKKLLLVSFFLLFFHILSYAPENKPTFLIQEPVKINYYEPLVKAIVKVESAGNPLAYNASEGAVGAFQIRQCRIKHYNRLTGKNYTLNEMYDYNKAKEVFLYFAVGKSYERAAKSWNGSGPMTIIYWSKVQKALNS